MWAQVRVAVATSYLTLLAVRVALKATAAGVTGGRHRTTDCFHVWKPRETRLVSSVSRSRGPREHLRLVLGTRESTPHVQMPPVTVQCQPVRPRDTAHGRSS